MWSFDNKWNDECHNAVCRYIMWCTSYILLKLQSTRTIVDGVLSAGLLKKLFWNSNADEHLFCLFILYCVNVFLFVDSNMRCWLQSICWKKILWPFPADNLALFYVYDVYFLLEAQYKKKCHCYFCFDTYALVASNSSWNLLKIEKKIQKFWFFARIFLVEKM